jgi:hypothetical protein
MTIQKLIDLNNETTELLLKVTLDEYAKEIIRFMRTYEGDKMGKTIEDIYQEFKNNKNGKSKS